jgi:ribosomal protein S18 acetylase RimI-like enzyme
MTPIFDAHHHLAAFFDGTYLFDLDNEWLAFHDRGHVFSTAGTWLGPLADGAFLDRDGRPVGWLAGAPRPCGATPSAPMNARRPMPPKRPLRPRTPLPPPRPLPPGGGWSALSWAQWIGRSAAAIAPAPLSIQPLDGAGLPAFFDYLDDHLRDNGRDGVYFAPVPHALSQAGVRADTRAAFADGLAVAVGVPGWRRLWVARDARGHALAHVDLRAHPEPFTGHRCVLGMGVHRDHRRAGLGRRLLAHAAGWAGEQGLRWIDLRVLSSNEAAVALYRAEGFQMQGGTPDMFAIDGRSLGWIAMARKLA